MLTAGASLDVLSKQLTDCRTSSPQHLVASVVASRAVIMAAAAVVEKPEVLHGGSPRMRTREASHRWKP